MAASKPRILFVAPRTPKEGSAGIENYVLHMAIYMKKKGFAPEIWGVGKKATRHVEDGIPLRSFPGWSPQNTMHFSFELFRALQKEEAEIIHANGYNNLTTLVAALAKKKGQFLCVTLNSSPPATFFTRVLRPFYDVAFRLVAKKFDKVICVSQNELRIFSHSLGLPLSRFVVIPNGIDPAEFARVKAKRNSLGIVYIGRMVPNKGHARLLRALPFVKKEFPGVHVHLVGSGPQENGLKDLVNELGLRDAVTFHGTFSFAQRPKLIRVLKESQVLTLLSDYEGNPLVLHEGMAAGMCLVVQDVGAMHEYVLRGDAVGVKDAQNAEEVAHALLRVLRSPSKFTATRAPDTWDSIGQKTLKSVYPPI